MAVWRTPRFLSSFQGNLVITALLNVRHGALVTEYFLHAIWLRKNIVCIAVSDTLLFLLTSPRANRQKRKLMDHHLATLKRVIAYCWMFSYALLSYLFHCLISIVLISFTLCFRTSIEWCSAAPVRYYATVASTICCCA